jgi:hypothetical protein
MRPMLVFPLPAGKKKKIQGRLVRTTHRRREHGEVVQVYGPILPNHIHRPTCRLGRLGEADLKGCKVPQIHITIRFNVAVAVGNACRTALVTPLIHCAREAGVLRTKPVETGIIAVTEYVVSARRPRWLLVLHTNPQAVAGVGIVAVRVGRIATG